MYNSSQRDFASSVATPPQGLLLTEKTSRLYFESIDQLSTYITKHRDHFDQLCRGENETVILFELSGNKKLPANLAEQLHSILGIPTSQQEEVVTCHRFAYLQGRLPENGRIIHVCVHHEPTASYKGALYCTNDKVTNYVGLLDRLNDNVFKYKSDNCQRWYEGIARSPAFSLDGRELSSLTHLSQVKSEHSHAVTTPPEDLPSFVRPFQYQPTGPVTTPPEDLPSFVRPFQYQPTGPVTTPPEDLPSFVRPFQYQPTGPVTTPPEDLPSFVRPFQYQPTGPVTTRPEDLPSLVGPSNAGSTFTLKINFPETLLQRAKNNIDDILANFGTSKSTELKWAKDNVTFLVSCDANVNPQNMADMLNTVLKSEISMRDFHASIESDKPVCSNSPNDTNSSMHRFTSTASLVSGASDISSKDLISERTPLISGSSKPNMVRRMGRAALAFLNLGKSSQHSYDPEANL
jgi:hypothetical protein